VEREGQPASGLQPGKRLALLGYLVAQRQPLSREHLADLLWPDLPAARGRANLSWTLHKLSSALPNCLRKDRGSVQFRCPDGCWSDLDAFEALTTQGDAEALGEGAVLYRGGFLQGLSVDGCADYELWLVGERERWRQRAERVLGKLIAHHDEQGACAEALHYARRLLVLAPWREETHRQAMRLLAESGQRGAALAQYETCRRALDAELDVAPSAETVRLYEQIVAGGITPLPAPEGPTISAPPRHNLPAPLTSFVGREALLVEVRERLQDSACRLLTLVGPGGSGKTRLSLEAAADRVPEYVDGVYLVSLAPLQSIEAIVPTIAQTIGFSFYGRGDPRQQLLNHLRQKNMLLILDNYEHLLTPFSSSPAGGIEGGQKGRKPTAERGNGAGVAIDILNAAPEVQILVTSRVRLNVPGEHLILIGGMDVPPLPSFTDGRGAGNEDQYSAVQMFLQSARRVQPSFELRADNLQPVIQICRLVDGMPLGILLAAAWMPMLTPAEIARELTPGSSNRLDFLETEWREVPERQRSMRAVFDHSWHLLTERARKVLQGLSVFRGGCTRDAAEQVIGASLRELRALVNRSLLERAPTGRYEVHELLRQYAAEKLDRSQTGGTAMRDRHAAYYAAALQRWARDLKGHRQMVALTEIEADLGNVRAAWDWTVERGQVEWLDRALEGLCLFYEWRGHHQEGEVACRKAVGRLRASPPEHLPATVVSGPRLRVLARALAWQGSFSFTLGQDKSADRCCECSLAVLDDPRLHSQDSRPEKAFGLYRMSMHAAFAGHIEMAKRLAARSLAIYRALGDQWGMVKVLIRQGVVAWRFGAHGEAQQAFEESLDLSQTLGDRRGAAWALTGLGGCAGLLDQIEEEERLVGESIALAQQVGDGELIIAAGGLLGYALRDQGRFTEARSSQKEILAVCRDHQDHHREITLMLDLGGTEIHVGSYDEARALARAALNLSRELGQRSAVAGACVQLGRLALTEDAYDEAQGWLTQSVASYEQAGRPRAMGGALATLPYVARGLSQPIQALQHLRAVLQTAAQVHRRNRALASLPAMALLLMDDGQVERAVELYALASSFPYVANSRWFEDIAGKHISAAALTLSPDAVASVQERGRARDLWTTVQELLVELNSNPLHLAC
jgi:predicted ATPase/DNA-binding SARP family transcriptional activator